jgi:hypothetical protein
MSGPLVTLGRVQNRIRSLLLANDSVTLSTLYVVALSHSHPLGVYNPLPISLSPLSFFEDYPVSLDPYSPLKQCFTVSSNTTMSLPPATKSIVSSPGKNAVTDPTDKVALEKDIDRKVTSCLASTPKCNPD